MVYAIGMDRVHLDVRVLVVLRKVAAEREHPPLAGVVALPAAPNTEPDVVFTTRRSRVREVGPQPRAAR
jgi:hypothetical protein